MICLSSAAVVRLARAGHAYKPYHTPKTTTVDGNHHQHTIDASPRGHILMAPIVEAAERELIDAAMAVAYELLADRHHERLGD